MRLIFGPSHIAEYPGIRIRRHENARNPTQFFSLPSRVNSKRNITEPTNRLIPRRQKVG
jgi:hypothetical protein